MEGTISIDANGEGFISYGLWSDRELGLNQARPHFETVGMSVPGQDGRMIQGLISEMRMRSQTLFPPGATIAINRIGLSGKLLQPKQIGDIARTLRLLVDRVTGGDDTTEEIQILQGEKLEIRFR